MSFETILLILCSTLAIALGFCAVRLNYYKKSLSQTESNLTDALQREKLHLRQVLDSAYQLMILLDCEGRIQMANISAMELVTEKEKELIGLPLWKAPWWNASFLMEQDLEQQVGAAVNGKPQQFFAKHLNVQGDLLDMDVSISPILLEGKVALIMVEANDISAMVNARESEHQARKDAEAANRAKSDFLANMSHEIRTPMNAIIGMNRLALKTDLSERQRQFLESVDSAAKSLLGIINDILDFSKVEAGKLDLEFIPFSLREVFNNVISMMALKAEEKGLEFSVNDVGVPYHLVGDPLRLQQVLTNLCFNAVKFTDKGYIAVTVSVVEKSAHQVRLKFDVEDSGIGLTQQQQDHLFDAFSQADSSVTRRYGGTGLGLTISKQLVNALGGEIKVSSDYGKGSVFSFVLPFKLADSEEKEVSEKNVTKKEGCILVVDDNPVCCQIEEKILSKAGYEVLVAETGREACSLVERFQDQIQLILMDWELPDMNGVEVSKEIIALSEGEAPPIIMVTAYGQEQVSLDSDFTPQDFMSKPISASALLAVVNEALSLDGASSYKPTIQKKSMSRADLGEAPRILLVEDNEINRFLASENLRAAGLQVITAENGKLALDELSSDEMDLVLMDLQMPVMDGLESCRHIREKWTAEQLPVVAITANAFAEEKRHCKEVGMNSFMSKPFEVEELYKVVAENLPSRFASWSQFLLQMDSIPATHHQVDIHGVDIDGALKRLRGDWENYARLSEEFVDEFGQSADAIELLTEREQWEEAAQLSHRLKGVSGNLGFSRTCELAQSLERACKEENTQLVMKLVVALRDASNEVIASINLIQEKAQQLGQQNSIESDVFNGVELHDYIDGIHQRLEASEVLDVSEIKTLRTQLKPLLGEESAEIIKQIENFNYAAALSGLDAAKQQIQPEELLRKPC